MIETILIVDDECAIADLVKNLIVKGVFTHLGASDVLCPKEQDFTKAQTQTFYQVVAQLRAQGSPCPKLHLVASYRILNYPQLAEDYARVGIALYGVFSTKSVTEASSLSLNPVLSLKARVAAVKELKPGESTGYGLAFTCSQDMKIAVLSIGYADGLQMRSSASWVHGWSGFLCNPYAKIMLINLESYGNFFHSCYNSKCNE